MKIRKGIQISDEDAILYDELIEKSKYYDRIQFCIKIRLNSTYGALTNYNFRFFKLEAGESVTGTGRMILRHQCRKVSEVLGGPYNTNFPLYETIKECEEHNTSPNLALHGPVFNGEFPADAIIYGDTDSAYFKTYAESADEAIQVADAVAEVVNASFPAFMKEAFLCQPGYDQKIKTSREIVSDRGIFVDKKRYMLHIIDNEGESVDKLKIMGLELKKTTLPKPIQKALTSFIERLLKGATWDSIAAEVVEYKKTLISANDILSIGLPKGVNNVENYTTSYLRDNTCRLPGHVAAAIFYNIQLVEYKDLESPAITSGSKLKVYYLKTKFGKFKSIALPTDIDIIPDWFIENFQPIIDRDAQLYRLVDKPLEHILNAIGEVVPTAHLQHVKELFVF